MPRNLYISHPLSQRFRFLLYRAARSSRLSFPLSFCFSVDLLVSRPFATSFFGPSSRDAVRLFFLRLRYYLAIDDTLHYSRCSKISLSLRYSDDEATIARRRLRFRVSRACHPDLSCDYNVAASATTCRHDNSKSIRSIERSVHS